MVLTEPGLSTIIEAIRGARIIFQRMRNYAIYVSIRIQTAFSLESLTNGTSSPFFRIFSIAGLLRHHQNRRRFQYHGFRL